MTRDVRTENFFLRLSKHHMGLFMRIWGKRQNQRKRKWCPLYIRIFFKRMIIQIGIDSYVHRSPFWRYVYWQRQAMNQCIQRYTHAHTFVFDLRIGERTRKITSAPVPEERQWLSELVFDWIFSTDYLLRSDIYHINRHSNLCIPWWTIVAQSETRKRRNRQKSAVEFTTLNIWNKWWNLLSVLVI